MYNHKFTKYTYFIIAGYQTFVYCLRYNIHLDENQEFLIFSDGFTYLDEISNFYVQ